MIEILDDLTSLATPAARRKGQLQRKTSMHAYSRVPNICTVFKLKSSFALLHKIDAMDSVTASIQQSPKGVYDVCAD